MTFLHKMLKMGSVCPLLAPWGLHPRTGIGVDDIIIPLALLVGCDSVLVGHDGLQHYVHFVTVVECAVIGNDVSGHKSGAFFPTFGNHYRHPHPVVAVSGPAGGRQQPGHADNDAVPAPSPAPATVMFGASW
ncbi:MAG: hypothetical protein OXC68_07210 [Aestuariivita sp.]|nr:hypothetical protein [Aestuariivita sp.]